MTGWCSISEMPTTAKCLDGLLDDIRACQFCASSGVRQPLKHDPRPVLRASSSARIAVCGQAPGTRVHATGLPFNDRSGVRLRAWMGVTEAEFYDERNVACVPIGFCFPGQDGKGADLPPRTECAPRWRTELFTHLSALELMLLVGRHAQAWHLGLEAGPDLTTTVCRWREFPARGARPRVVPMPHPSWRNNGWLKANPWFERELIPELRVEVRRIIG